LTVPQELAEVVAEDVRVLNSRASGSGDVDCVIRGRRPSWPLRLVEWRLCQAVRYDVASTYYVLERRGETLALDVVDDPRGIGKYAFPTGVAFAEPAEPGALVSASVQAAYLTVKRIFKRQSDSGLWREIDALAAVDPGEYERALGAPLGKELAREVSGYTATNTVPSPDTVARWRRAMFRRRALAPRRVLARGWGTLARVADRVLRPTGLVVVIVGPDGAGKSTVAKRLPAECGQLFRRSLRIHFRPGILPQLGTLLRRPPTDVTQPHGRRPHGVLMSYLLLLYYWADALLGYLLKVQPTKIRTGLVVVERGFLDLAVDPLRYRLRVRRGLVLALARLLPRADLVLVLDIAPEIASARKGELPAEELARQSAVWRDLDHVRTEVALVDGGRPRAEVLADAHRQVADRLAQRALCRCEWGWAALPSARSPRLIVPRRPRAYAHGALRLEHPATAKARTGLRVARAGIAAGGMSLTRRTAFPEEVRDALAPHLSPGSTVALKRATHPGRFIAVELGARGQPLALVKLATDDLGRARLRAEAATLDRVAPHLVRPLRAPAVRNADDGLLILEWIDHRWRRDVWRLPVEVAQALGVFFAVGLTDTPDAIGGWAHGDAAPWNLLRARSGWALVDWEVALEDAPPFYDVFHYVVQSHAALGRPRRADLLRGIQGYGWIGEAVHAYAHGAGLSPALAASSFDRYLEHTTAVHTRVDMDARSLRLRRELRSARA
jgi:thymidylate kinase